MQIPIAQYRNKIYNKKKIESDLKVIKANFSGKLIINDYVEFIDLADGLHLGQDDLSSIDKDFKIAIKIVRDKIKNKILGLSTHNIEEIKVANTLEIDYIGLGAYRATNTKDNVKVKGFKLLNVAKESNKSVAIIGGVKLNDNFPKEIEFKVIGSDLMKKFLIG